MTPQRLLLLALVMLTARLRAEPVKPILEWKGPPANAVARVEAGARELMALSEADALAMVPVQTPFITSDCPSCGAGHYFRGLDRKLFSFALPGQLTCLKCQTTFPSEQFPINERVVFFNTRDEKVEIGFHRNAAGQRFAIPGTIQSWQNGWLVERVEAVAQLYQAIGEERYARRVAVILDRYAQVFPHWLVKNFVTELLDTDAGSKTQKSGYVYSSTGGPWMRDGKPRGERPKRPEASNQPTSLPYKWTESRWGWSRFGGEMPMELLKAYDLVHGSAEFEKLSAELKVDVRQRITRGLFGNAVGFLQEYPWWYQLNNNASSHIAHMIKAGRVLGQPEWVHFGYRWSRDVLEKYSFSRDGAFAESPGYFYVFLATQEENFNALTGYSDPLGFKGKDGLHLENLGTTGSGEFLAKARAAVESIRFPNGSLLPLGDNRHDDFVDPLFRVGTSGTALPQSRNVLLPGYGHAVLGDGAGDRQVQTHLQFSKFTGVTHTHRDGLSLMLFAFGSEFFTGIGYHKTKYRGYASTTLSHNTVVMDRRPQEGPEPKGNVLLYEPNLPGLAMVQVEQKGAYAGLAQRYRRTLIQNTRDLEAPYVVDVFEVRGGQMHDYVLHGPTVFDSLAECSLPLTPLPGERPLLAKGESWGEDTVAAAYGVFTNVRHARPTGDFSVTWKLVKPYELPEYFPNVRYRAGKSFHYAVDPASYAGQPELGVRTHFVAAAGSEVLLADSPSLLRSGLQGSRLTEKLKRPSLLVRRQSNGELSSLFVAIHEPYCGSPKIVAVRSMGGSGVDLQIDFVNRVDSLSLSLDESSEAGAPSSRDATPHSKRLAFVSKPRTGRVSAYLIGGTELNSDGVQLTSPVSSYRGTIGAITSKWDGAAANTFVTSTPIPAGNGLRGTWMIVTFGNGAASEAFEIDHIESAGNATTIHLRDDPGLRSSGARTTEIFFPRRQFSGPNTFTILTKAATP